MVRSTSQRAALAVALAAALGCLAAAARPAASQTEYRDLDAGRPIRVEDATVTARYELEAQLPTVRYERLDAGTDRWQLAPKLSYGVLPRTELEVRAPVAFFPQGAGARVGLAGLGVGGMHNFNLETTWVPALAAGVEVLLPVGALAARPAAVTVKGIAPRSTRAGRLHLNAAVGTYAGRGWSSTGGSAGGTSGRISPGSSPPAPRTRSRRGCSWGGGTRG